MSVEVQYEVSEAGMCMRLTKEEPALKVIPSEGEV